MTLSEILQIAQKDLSKIKLCAFDFDSTLMDGETIDILANAYGVGDKVKEITHKAMNGELDFFESLTQRVALLKGMPCSLVDEICANLPLMQGAKELIEHLKSKKILVVVFSGGFHEGIDEAQRCLNLTWALRIFCMLETARSRGLWAER